jgi:hypothetical protein
MELPMFFRPCTRGYYRRREEKFSKEATELLLAYADVFMQRPAYDNYNDIEEADRDDLNPVYKLYLTKDRFDAICLNVSPEIRAIVRQFKVEGLEYLRRYKPPHAYRFYLSQLEAFLSEIKEINDYLRANKIKEITIPKNFFDTQ